MKLGMAGTKIIVKKINTTCEFRREWTFSDTSSVSLNNSNDSFDELRRNTQTSADSTNRCIGGSHIRVGTEIDIKQASICTFY